MIKKGMKIAFFEIEDWEKPYLQARLQNDEILFFSETLTKDNVSSVSDVQVLSPFIYSSITKEILDRMPSLRLIATRSTGYDHIDLPVCLEKNINVCNVPVYGTHTVAEHTFALMLALSRKLVPSIERARRGDFSLAGLRGFELFGKTLGVIGVGHIGVAVIKIANGFGMKVIAYTKHPKDTNQGAEFVDLQTLLSNSDIVTLHVPHNKETHHMINKQNIEQFKKGSLLINTSRGGLVETEAILVGLEKGYLAGAGIDVLEEECTIKEERQLLTEQFLKECDIKTQLLNHVLLTKDNVVITPHNAFNSIEALQRILDVTAENIISFVQNNPQNAIKL